MKGTELSAEGAKIMIRGGWTRLWCANWRKPLPNALRGLSDNGYIRDEVLLFIEDKGDGDKLSEQQEWFKAKLDEHAPDNVHYLIASKLEDYKRFVNIRRVV
jgi:hypothetical protein